MRQRQLNFLLHGHPGELFQVRINYIEEISIKSDAKKIKYYQISKKLS